MGHRPERRLDRLMSVCCHPISGTALYASGHTPRGGGRTPGTALRCGYAHRAASTADQTAAARPLADSRLPHRDRICAIAERCWSRHPSGTPIALGLAAVAVLSLAMGLRRRQPALALAVVLVVLVTLDVPYQSLLPAWSALYHRGGHRPAADRAGRPRRRAHRTGGGGGVFDRGVLLGLISSLVWTIGYAVGRHRAYERELRLHQARQAETELEKARRGVTEERMRIARELHDVVAHSMSVITVQAGFGHLVIDDQPAQARAALGAIETTGREALDRNAQLLGVLRDDGPGVRLTPAPGLAELDHLVAQTAKAGVRSSVTITGAPGHCRRGSTCRHSGSSRRHSPTWSSTPRPPIARSPSPTASTSCPSRSPTTAAAARPSTGTATASSACASGCTSTAEPCRPRRCPDGDSGSPRRFRSPKAAA